ncbi:MAG: lipopolysaccharide biosynthesis protein [Nitrospirota bacterium]
MQRIIKPSSFIKDMTFTSITFITTVVSLIVVTRFLAEGLGPEMFGAYSLARNILSTTISFSTLAMGVAIPRYVALTKDYHIKISYLLSGLILISTSCLILLTLGLIFNDKLTVLIFNDRAYSSLFTASMVMVIGYSLYSVLYGFYRGLGKMSKANLWQLTIMAVSPAVIAFAFHKSGKVDLIIFLMGLVSFTTVIPLISYGYKALLIRRNSLKIWSHLKELSQYSFPRIPGGIALASIMTIGPFLASHFISLKDAGYVIVGQCVFRIVEGGVGVFGIVTLPKVAQLFAEGRNEFLSDRANDILSFIFHLGLFATLHLILWTDRIIFIWLGEQYIDAILPTRVFLIVLVPYLIYAMFCSVIDAIEKRAVNAYHIYISFITTLCISLILVKTGFGILGLAIGVAGGYLMLGSLTVIYLFKVYRFRYKTLEVFRCLLLNAFFIIAALIAKKWFEITYHGMQIVKIAIIMEVCFLLIYCFLLWKMNVGWMVELKNRIVSVGSGES